MPSFGGVGLASTMATSGGMGTRVGSAFVSVFADISGLQRGFASAEAMSKSFATRMTAAGTVTARAGAMMTRNLTVPLVALGGISAKMAADFETSMTKVAVLAKGGAIPGSLKQLREDVLALSGETAQAPMDVADSLFFVASAGLKANDVMPVLRASAEGAAAQLGDAATIGQLLTSVLNAYPEGAINAAQAMDILTVAVRRGKAEPADLSASLGTVIPVAAQMKVEFNEVAGAIAASTNIGIEAARAATGLRYMLIQLMNPTETAKNTLKEYGLEVKDVQKAVSEDLVGGLKMLADQFDINSVKGKEAFFTTVGGVRSGQVALALIGKSYEATREIVDATGRAVSNADQEFQKALDRMKKTPGFEMDKAWNDLKLAAIEVGEIILPVALDIVNAIGDLAKAFANLSDPVQESIVQIGLWVAAAGPLLAIFGRLYRFGGLVAGAFKVGTKALPAAAAAAGGVAAPAAGTLAGPLMGAGMTLPVRGAASAWAGGAAAAPAAGTAATGVSAAGAWGVAMAEQAVIAAGLVYAGGMVSKAIDAATTSTEDLADSTGLTTANVLELKNQLHDTAFVLHPFASTEDRVREGGEILNEVAADLAKTLDISLGTALANVQGIIKDSDEDIGGITGSLDTLEQNLRGRLGILETADAATLMERRLGEVLSTVEAYADFTLPGAESVNEFVAGLISVERAGLNVDEVMGDQLRDALDSNLIRWAQLTQWFERAGVAMPYSRAGDMAQAIFLMDEATVQQRAHLADTVALLGRYNILMSDSAQSTVDHAVATSNAGAAQEAINEDIGIEAVAALVAHSDAINKNNAAWFADQIAAGNYLAVLERIETIERNQEQRARREERKESRERRKEGVPTPMDFPYGGRGISIATDQVRELLETEPDLREFRKVLMATVVLRTDERAAITDTITSLENEGIAWDDLTKKARRGIIMDIQTGDAQGALDTLAQILVDVIAGRHNINVKANTKGANNDLDETQGRVDDLDNTTAKPSVNIEGNAATEARNIKSTLDAIPGTYSAVVEISGFGPGGFAGGGAGGGGGGSGSGGGGTSDTGGGSSWQTGGWITGTGRGDIRAAMLEPGEFVVRRRSAQQLGSLLEDINAKGAMAFHRPTRGRGGGSSPIMTMAGVGGRGAGGGQRTLNVNVQGRMEYTPDDLRRNLEGWWRRRDW